MELKDKYAKLLDYAVKSGVQDLSVIEKDKVLHISGTASADVKEKMWNLYNQIDPDMRSGDLVMDITEKSGSRQAYEIKAGDSLSKIAQHYPGMTWQKIYEANKDVIKDPDKIYPGQTIIIPQA